MNVGRDLIKFDTINETTSTTSPSSSLLMTTALVHLQPLVLTTIFPHYSNVDDFVKTVTNNVQEHGDDEETKKKNLDESSHLYISSVLFIYFFFSLRRVVVHVRVFFFCKRQHQYCYVV